MTDITRREAIALTGAAAVVATAPLPAVSATLTSGTPALPAWAVGTPGDWNWQHIRAESEGAAIRAWVSDEYGISPCERGETCGDGCDYCEIADSIQAERLPRWDGLDRPPNNGDWLDAGMGAYCNRCGYETDPDCGGRNVNGDAVCEDCMTIEDWEQIDPEHAEELCAELADE